MTKEEAINLIIKNQKEGITFSKTWFCEDHKCTDCPLLTYAPCEHGVIRWLVDRLIKAEEKKETNLEHYFKNANVAISKGFLNILFGDEVIEAFGNGKATYDVRAWFLSPYKEPKQKYKLTQFEHDLLECYYVNELGIEDFWVTDHMHKKGYFKDIPTDIRIKDILDNCEVV